MAAIGKQGDTMYSIGYALNFHCWGMNWLAKELSMVTTNLDGFSLANCRQFAKFAKLSSYTVLYSPLLVDILVISTQ